MHLWLSFSSARWKTTKPNKNQKPLFQCVCDMRSGLPDNADNVPSVATNGLGAVTLSAKFLHSLTKIGIDNAEMWGYRELGTVGSYQNSTYTWAAQAFPSEAHGITKGHVLDEISISWDVSNFKMKIWRTRKLCFHELSCMVEKRAKRMTWR